MEAYDGPQIVGMDLHRRRSVLVRMAEDGRKLATARITDGPGAAGRGDGRAGPRPRVVLEACYGWYWAADALAAAGAEVHLAHPLGVKAYSHRRVKNDLLTEPRNVIAARGLSDHDSGHHPERNFAIGRPRVPWLRPRRHRRRTSGGEWLTCLLLAAAFQRRPSLTLSVRTAL